MQKQSDSLPTGPFATIYADPPWRFDNRTGRAAPECPRLWRYPTMPIVFLERARHGSPIRGLNGKS